MKTRSPARSKAAARYDPRSGHAVTRMDGVIAAFLWRNPPADGQSLWANAAVCVVALLHGVRQIVEWWLVQRRVAAIERTA